VHTRTHSVRTHHKSVTMTQAMHPVAHLHSTQEAPERRKGYEDSLVLGQPPRQRVLTALSSKGSAPDCPESQEDKLRVHARASDLRDTEASIQRTAEQIRNLHQQRLQAVQAYLVFLNFLHGDKNAASIPVVADCDANIKDLHSHVKTLFQSNSDLLDDIKRQTGPGSVLASMPGPAVVAAGTPAKKEKGAQPKKRKTFGFPAPADHPPAERAHSTPRASKRGRALSE
jgi:hypothetical protein